MDAFRSTQVLVASSVLAALGLYALYRGDAEVPLLVDDPETVASRVDDPKPTDTQKEHEYDVVVIGGGTTGCVIASRLSENPTVRVLLLEAGGSSRDVLSSKIPTAYGEMLMTPMDYGLFTEPQENAGGVQKYWPRAKLLGGCSTMNAMMFHAGAPTDYDEWALSGQEGASEWAYKRFVKYFLKFERFTPHPKFPNVNASLRGTDGPISTGYFGYFHAISAQYIKSCMRLGIPHSPDINASTGTMGTTKGKRVTTESAYLTPSVLRRTNLKVAVHSHVTRILFETHAGKKKAVGVEFAKAKDGPRYLVRARREVVLSAGSIHSPHILMLSGVGPKNQLVEHNIPLVHDLPGVGQNLQDHVCVALRLRVKKGLSMMYLRQPSGLWDKLRSYKAFFQWMIFGSGPLCSNLAEAAAFIRMDDSNLFPPDGYNVIDESSGANAPNMETLFIPLAYSQSALPSGDLVTLLAVLLRPQSRGTIALKSTSAFDAPSINPRYLDTRNDIAVLVRGFKHLMRITETEPLASFVVHDTDPALDHGLSNLTDSELEYEVRKRGETLYHPTSSCRMARLEDGGVVDPYLRVYGIENLRVADASIFPRIISGHTAGPCIAVGEKAADMIKASLMKTM